MAQAVEAGDDARAMVTLRRVASLAPIRGADRIELARVDGWPVVVRRGDFAVGDPCVFFEVDSFLPAGDPRLAMRNEPMSWEGRLGWRLSTMTMRGEVTQGLARRVDEFPEVAALVAVSGHEAVSRLDLSPLLGVLRWERPVPAEIARSAVGALPARIGRTSLPRIQNVAGTLFAEHAGHAFEATLKLDGMSAHVFRLDGRVRAACGKWEVRDTGEDLVWEAAKASGLVAALDHDAFEGLQVQAEVIGRGLRMGYHEGREGTCLVAFHVHDNVANRGLGREARLAALDRLRARGARVEEAPTLGVVELDDLGGDVAPLLAYASGPGLDGTRRREGAVFRRLDGGYAFKAIDDGSLLAGTAD